MDTISTFLQSSLFNVIQRLVGFFCISIAILLLVTVRVFPEVSGNSLSAQIAILYKRITVTVLGGFSLISGIIAVCSGLILAQHMQHMLKKEENECHAMCNLKYIVAFACATTLLITTSSTAAAVSKDTGNNPTTTLVAFMLMLLGGGGLFDVKEALSRFKNQ